MPKISSLTTASSAASTDLLPINVSGATKKISVANLLAAALQDSGSTIEDDGTASFPRLIAGPTFIVGFHSFSVLNPMNSDPVFGVGLKYDLDINAETATDDGNGFQQFFQRARIRQQGTPVTMVNGALHRINFSIEEDSHLEHLEALLIDGGFSGNSMVDAYYGIRIMPPSLGDAAVASQLHALRIEDHSPLGAAAYNIVSSGVNSKNLFAGDVTAQTFSGVKKYVAYLEVSGSDLIATVLENSLGGTVVWTRSEAGAYQGVLAGAFTAHKTLVRFTALTSIVLVYAYPDFGVEEGNEINILAYSDFEFNPADTKGTIEVIVYP